MQSTKLPGIGKPVQENSQQSRGTVAPARFGWTISEDASRKIEAVSENRRAAQQAAANIKLR